MMSVILAGLEHGCMKTGIANYDTDEFSNEVPLYRISFEQDIVQRSIRGYIFDV